MDKNIYLIREYSKCMKKSTIKMLFMIVGGLIGLYIAISLFVMLLNMIIPILVFLGLGYVAYIVLKVAFGSSTSSEASKSYESGDLYRALSDNSPSDKSANTNLTEDEIYERYINGEIDEDEMELLLEQTLNDKEEVLEETN